MQKVAGLILAAGASSRMGSPKPLLKVGGKTLLEDQVMRIRKAGLENIYVVVGYDSDKIKNTHKTLDVIWVENKNWERGKFSSVLCGITAIPSTGGILLLPIDTVGVLPSIMKQVVDKGLKSNRNVVPTFNGHGGHPVFLTTDFALTLIGKNADANRLDELLNLSDVCRLPVISNTILRNINTPEEWHKTEISKIYCSA